MAAIYYVSMPTNFCDSSLPLTGPYRKKFETAKGWSYRGAEGGSHLFYNGSTGESIAFPVAMTVVHCFTTG